MLKEDPQWAEKVRTKEGIVELIKTQKSNSAVYSYAIDEQGKILNQEELTTINKNIQYFTGTTVQVAVLAAYAQEVTDKTIDPTEEIKIREWEKRYLPVSDRGSHIVSVQALGIDADDYGYAKNPSVVVTWDQIVQSMVRYSDKSATDFLVEKMGPEKIDNMMKKSGLNIPYHSLLFAGTELSLDNHDSPLTEESLSDYLALPFIDRKNLVLEKHKQFIDNENWRNDEIDSRKGLRGRQVYPKLRRKVVHNVGPRASAEELNTLMTNIVVGNFPTKEANKIVKRHLEWQIEDPSIAEEYEVLALKGGTELGILSFTLYAKSKQTKQTRVSTVIFNNMPISGWLASQQNEGINDFIKGLSFGDPGTFKILNTY